MIEPQTPALDGGLDTHGSPTNILAHHLCTCLRSWVRIARAHGILNSCGTGTSRDPWAYTRCTSWHRPLPDFAVNCGACRVSQPGYA